MIKHVLAIGFLLLAQTAIASPNATVGQMYRGDLVKITGLAGTFAKRSGPAWLTVSSEGSVSGIPTESDEGENHFDIWVQQGGAGVLVEWKLVVEPFTPVTTTEVSNLVVCAAGVFYGEIVGQLNDVLAKPVVSVQHHLSEELVIRAPFTASAPACMDKSRCCVTLNKK